MIHIRRTPTSLSISGHARGSEGDEFSLVCAAASVLYYTARDNLGEDIIIDKCRPGETMLSWRGEAPCMDVLSVGFRHLARDYADYATYEEVT